jgi:hypothetical protein
LYGGVRQEKGKEIAQYQIYPFYDEDRAQGIDGKRHESDKCLIAAAPELLAACKAIIAADELDPRTWSILCAASIATSDAFSLARAAIAKASALTD